MDILRENPALYINDGPALYLNADKTQVVAEGSPDAAFLLVGPGGSLLREEAERYGLLDTTKAKAAPANKNKPAPGNK